MTQEHSADLRQLAGRLLADAELLADRWRLAGRWRDAQTLLQGLHPVALEHGDAALTRCALLIGRVLTDQAMFGDADTAAEREALLDRALAHAQAAGDPALLGAAWDAKGFSLHAAYLGSDRSVEPTDELAYFERGLDLRRTANDRRGMAESLFHIGLVYGVIRRDHPGALPYFQDSYRLAQESGDQVMASYAIRHIAFAQQAVDDLPAARAGLEESLRLREEAGFVPGVAMGLVALAHEEANSGQHARAVELLSRARDIFTALGAPGRSAWVEATIAQFNHA